MRRERKMREKQSFEILSKGGSMVKGEEGCRMLGTDQLNPIPQELRHPEEVNSFPWASAFLPIKTLKPCHSKNIWSNLETCDADKIVDDYFRLYLL